MFERLRIPIFIRPGLPTLATATQAATVPG
jgi:hypothetical protein